ncbi:hypothetical protein K505DRAFT_380369 [Melanomma pulvis-pyrius CBS 109.77]|uniref:Uncharacterized protein n=1 Tax=Melanomma pulvis-pyrius CBS 109.77 TaxID=1314802 RepID=A0A6A6WR41_9PLEO|nr:hypothetical protein K505DRAFT_380369 [Melanomma pulvis-pyrius CBS 109.77]
MPRHHRQRPSWLPAWIPYKDGRYLGLARQTILAWSSTILALTFFLMTVSYATEKSRFSNVKFVHTSRSNTILVLRILSEAAGIFLASTIYSTFEVVQWVLISRPGGIQFPQFLALQSSTGPLGLMVLAFGKGLPPHQWGMKPRIMSLIRLIAEVAVPVLGVLVMSNVDTKIVYVPLKDTLQPFAFGMEPFNGSVALQLGTMKDLFFNIGYVSFLANPLHAIDITPHSARGPGCPKGVSITTSESCTRSVLITQEYQNVEATLPLNQYLESQVVLSKHQQIYSFEYHDNIELSKDTLSCEMFHSGPAYYRLCIRNGENEWIQAAIIPCPVSLMIAGNCTQDNSWHSSPGFTTAMKASFVTASVSYDRGNGQVLSHEIESDTRPVSFKASELLAAMAIILNATATPTNLTISNPILGSPSNFFGRMVAGQMYRIGKLMNSNPLARLKGVNAIQSLLGITIFYCQNGVLGQTILAYAPNAISTQNYQVGAFEKQQNSSLVALAETRYRIEVGRATLIAYTVLGGVTLLICFLTLAVGSILELVKLDAEPTLFPSLDFFTQCKVEDQNGKVVPPHKRVELAWIRDGQEMFKEIERLKVTRRKRMIREPERELPGVEAGDDQRGLGGCC